MKPKNFPGRKYRRKNGVEKWTTRINFNFDHPEISDMCIRLGKQKRNKDGTTR